ncbi:MAG: glycoside hydrolase family 97 catalytic domain-containing protein [Bryobacteraceae bacterium]|jgi:alpha-glucosidase
MKIGILCLLALFCLSLPAVADVTVASPDGRVRFVLSQSAQAHLEYTVTFNTKNIVDPSPLGIVVDGVDLAGGARIGNVQSYKTDETYPWYGPHSTAIDKSNGAKVALTHPKTGTSYTLEIRAYDDGIAFRHLVPGEGARTPDEATVFRVPAGSLIAPQNYVSGYEGVYPWRTTTNTIEGMMDGEWTHPPFTFVLRDKTAYASITEGALVNYSGMVFQADAAQALHARLGHAEPAIFGFRTRYPKDIERLTHPAVIDGPITTPWRIVMIGPDLNTLFNCDIVHNVSPPPDPKLFPQGLHTEWIKPGRAVWNYLDGTDPTVEGQKEMARLAAQLGFEYNVIEGFWRNWPEAQLKDLADYSRQRGVKLILWSSRAQVQDPQKLQEWFDMCNRVGAAGVKIDFFDHEHKEVVDLYRMMAKAGAEHKLLVDFHGANKPTGLERTYPNIVGIEAVRGMEFFPPYAQHDVVLPFTRLLAGMADYTPTHFGSRVADTTWAHQVANAVILQSPLLVYAAHPVNILANPTVDLLKSIPTYWDETVVLPVSEIREVAAFARRSGDTWFLAVTNGPTARNVRIDLSTFLGKGPRASFHATLVRDAGEAAAVKIEQLTLSASDSLSVDLRSGGGFVARFKR